MIVPGTIVVIDDEPADAMKDLVRPLREKGERVLLYNEDSLDLDGVINVRLAILDWDLMKTEELSLDINGPKVFNNIKKILEHSEFCLIIIWSVLAGKKEDRSSILDKLMEISRTEMPSHILNRDNIKIFEDKYKSENLIQSIKEWISQNHNAGLIFEWEKSVEIARDKLVAQIYDVNIELIIKEISEQYSMDGTLIEISHIFSRILSRHIDPINSNLLEYIKKIVENGSMKSSNNSCGDAENNIEEGESEDVLTTDDLNWYSKFHYIQNYNHLTQSNPVMTGDLLFNPDEDHFNYYLVINPICDFVQKKVDRIKYIKGCKIPEISSYRKNDDPESILQYITNFCWKKFVKTTGGVKKELLNRSEAISNSIKGNLNKRFYPILYIKDNPVDVDYYHINFDFNNVCNIKAEISEELNIKIPEGWIRVLRADYPILEDVIQSYSSYCNRVGTSEYEKYIDMEIKKRKEFKPSEVNTINAKPEASECNDRTK